jgi:hypothetical protein
MDNGLVNLAAIVGMLFFCQIAVPLILVIGTDRSKSGTGSVGPGSVGEEAQSHK